MEIKQFQSIIDELHSIKQQQEELKEKESKLRKQIIDTMKEQELGQFKNDKATISMTTRKTVVYEDKDKVIENLKMLELDKYYETTTSVSKEFEEDIKNGVISFEGVSKTEKTIPMIKIK